MHPLKTLNFGIEIETLSPSHQAAARAIQSVVGGQIAQRYHGGLSVIADDGRTWSVVRDGSLHPSRGGVSTEVVSPILTYADLERVQEIVRALRRAGSYVNESCGIHIHVGAERLGAKQLINLCKIVHKQEPLLMYAMDIHSQRQSYCRSIDQTFMRRISQRKTWTRAALNEAWYGYYQTSPSRYDSTRYRALNLHALWCHGTVEFRWANGTLHAGHVKAYLQLALALVAKAMTVRTAQTAQRTFSLETSRYDMRVMLLGLGLIGDEFKTCRDHLMRRCEGSGSYKHGRPAGRSAA